MSRAGVPFRHRRREAGMADDDLRDHIEQLEANIEELAETAEGCRKILLFAKAVILLSGLSLLVIVLGPIRFPPAALIAAIAAVLGGIVVFGSNKSTLQRTNIDMKSAEALRDELIGRLELHAVDR
jgi:hypothetical protein